MEERVPIFCKLLEPPADYAPEFALFPSLVRVYPPFLRPTTIFSIHRPRFTPLFEAHSPDFSRLPPIKRSKKKK